MKRSILIQFALVIMALAILLVVTLDPPPILEVPTEIPLTAEQARSQRDRQRDNRSEAGEEEGEEEDEGAVSPAENVPEMPPPVTTETPYNPPGNQEPAGEERDDIPLEVFEGAPPPGAFQPEQSGRRRDVESRSRLRQPAGRPANETNY